MLVLSRYVGESIVIGDTFMVTVLAIEPLRTRLQASRVGAPQEVLSDSWLQVDEKLELEPGVSCMIVRIHNMIRLGVIAPRTTAVMRWEVHADNRQARPDASA